MWQYGFESSIVPTANGKNECLISFDNIVLSKSFITFWIFLPALHQKDGLRVMPKHDDIQIVWDLRFRFRKWRGKSKFNITSLGLTSINRKDALHSRDLSRRRIRRWGHKWRGEIAFFLRAPSWGLKSMKTYHFSSTKLNPKTCN